MPSTPGRPATMRDVAERAGVSRSLVSTVFRDVPGASPATRARVLEAAAELGYRPDDRARQLRSRDRRVIGVTLTAIHPFHVSVLESLHEAVGLRGYELSIALSTEVRPLARAVDSLLAQRCAALILLGPTDPADTLTAMARAAAGVPVIVVDRHLDVPELDAIRIDDDAAVSALVGHLVGLGHREIWHVGGGDYVSAEPRRAAYVRAMDAAGLAPEARVVEAGGTAREGAAAAMSLVDTGDLPTAIVAYNDRAACGIIDVLWRNGIRVPEDVSVVGFDNIVEADMPHMSITTVEQCPEALTSAVIDVLLGRLAGAPARGLHLIAPGPLVERTSTAAPRLSAAGSLPW